MNVTVDDDRCKGHGVCCSICPDVFTLTDDGYAEVSTPDVPSAFENAVQDAISNCPERAITAN